MPMYTSPIFITDHEELHLITYVQLLMILTVKVMAYTVLAYSYQVRLYDAFQFKAHAYYQYRLQPPYKDCRICLINHMRFISHHITLLVDRLGVVLRGQTAIFTQGRYHFQYKHLVKQPIWDNFVKYTLFMMSIKR